MAPSALAGQGCSLPGEKRPLSQILVHTDSPTSAAHERLEDAAGGPIGAPHHRRP